VDSRDAVVSLLRRVAIAVACALVLHALAFALIPRQNTTDAPQEAIVARVTLARIARTPTPRPSPTPTPPPTAIAKAVIPAGMHARVERIKHAGAKRPTPPKVVYATPDASIPTGGEGAGAQNAVGAGSLSATNGNGNGTGSGGNGNGSGPWPCGAIDFESMGGAQFDAATGYYERNNIVATVYYSDGNYQKVQLDWTWHFKSEEQDPFASDAVPMLFQFPPAAQRASEPSPVQYIIAHTGRDGRGTGLTDKCPNIPPLVPPSPGP
jgi:hypothetical protein